MEWLSGLRCYNHNCEVQIPLGTWLGLVNQPRYEALGDIWVENGKTQKRVKHWVNEAVIRQWSKIDLGTIK